MASKVYEDDTSYDQIASGLGPVGDARRPGVPIASSSKYSRKDYTQHQLFAIFALKTCFKTDYRTRTSFLILTEPCPKPRMTRRDKWAKRKSAERYRAWRDEVQLAITGVPAKKLECDVLGVVAFFHLPLPESCSGKKKAEHHGRLHRGSGDVDNSIKGVCDALFAEDKTIPVMQAYKLWVEEGESPRADLFLLVA